MDNLRELQTAIQSEIANENHAEIKAIQAAEKEAEKEAEKKLKMFNEHFEGLGIDDKKYEAYNKELSSITDANIKAIEAKLSGGNEQSFSISAEDIQLSSIDSALLDSKNHIVYPSFAQAFSTQEETADEISAMDVVRNNSTQRRWNWAKGAGRGLLGKGAASNTQFVEFGFWFRPSVSRVYSIVPLNIFRGFYIIQAFDGRWDSKEAKASVDISINVKQYNWKGWSTHNVMNVGSQNIDINRRLDTNRSNYHSALLGGGDWAFIRVRVKMYVYARGGGSYAKLDFASGSGSANYLQCPRCIIS